MYDQMIMTLMFIGLLIVVYVINGKKSKEYDNLPERYDLIVKFDSTHYVDIRELESFKTIASWHKYGEYGFRGFSVLKKEEVEKLIEDNFGINKDMFHVISATNMYIPS